MAECPQCKVGSLVERTNKKTGQTFYGCSEYPACKFAVASLDRLAPAEAKAPAPTSNSDELAASVRELAEAVRVLAGKLKSAENPSEAQGI